MKRNALVNRKLDLSKQTLRRLTAGELAVAAGAGRTTLATSDDCPTARVSCPSAKCIE
jgi:hypothetical protein